MTGELVITTSGVGLTVANVDITGNLVVNSLNVTTNTVTTSALGQVVLDTWPVGTGGLASAKYFVQANDSIVYHITEINFVTDGTNAYMTEYGTIETAYSLGSFSSTITAGQAQLLFTPASANSTQVRIVRHALAY